MKITYVAKHNSGDNDDEGAIATCLRGAGHEVNCVPERNGVNAVVAGGDLVLYHKWEDTVSLARIRVPRIFWFFDLVDSDDWDLKSRNAERSAWAKRTTLNSDLGFMTDGDWVAQYGFGKLVHLMQGADERIVGLGNAAEQDIDLLFTGSTIHGGKRISHIKELEEKLPRMGIKFVMRGHHPKDRVHGRQLADLMARAKVVLAPDGPVTNLYWSNRVYQACGFGACIAHPYCTKLAEHYKDGEEIVFYHNRQHLLDLLPDLLKATNRRAEIGRRALERTKREHLYRHRVA